MHSSEVTDDITQEKDYEIVATGSRKFDYLPLLAGPGQSVESC